MFEFELLNYRPPKFKNVKIATKQATGFFFFRFRPAYLS